MFKNLFTRHKITLLTVNWERVADFSMKAVPSIDELIYVESSDKYYIVVKVIHSIDKGHNILCVVKEHTRW